MKSLVATGAVGSIAGCSRDMEINNNISELRYDENTDKLVVIVDNKFLEAQDTEARIEEVSFVREDKLLASRKFSGTGRYEFSIPKNHKTGMRYIIGLYANRNKDERLFISRASFTIDDSGDVIIIPDGTNK
jgi:hypothetical protein